jgi:hypothetical protein
MPRVQYENLKRQSNHSNREGYDWEILTPLDFILHLLSGQKIYEAS